MELRQTHSKPDPGQTLSKALVCAAVNLGLNQGTVAKIVGVSPSTASRLFAGKLVLDPGDRKVWELAALFVRLYRSLDALLGHDEQAKAWLNGPNTALNAKPIDLIKKTEGLVRVTQYLDAYRGRI